MNFVKFRFSEKTTKFEKSPPCFDLKLSKRQNNWEIFSNFVAFSQYLNFTNVFFQIYFSNGQCSINCVYIKLDAETMHTALIYWVVVHIRISSYFSKPLYSGMKSAAWNLTINDKNLILNPASIITQKHVYDIMTVWKRAKWSIRSTKPFPDVTCLLNQS